VSDAATRRTPLALAWKLAARLLGRARRQWPLIGLTFAVMALLAASDRGRWVVLKPLLDSATAAGRGGMLPENLPVLLAVVVGLSLVAAVMKFAKEWLTQYLVARFTVDLRNEMAEHLLRMPMSRYAGARTGDVVSRMTHDVAYVNQAMDFLVADTLLQPLLALAAVAIILYGHPVLGGVLVLMFPLLAWVLARLGGRLRRMRKRSLQQLGDVTQAVTQILSGLRIVRAYGAEESEAAEFRRRNEEHFRTTMKAAARKAVIEAAVEVLVAIAAVCVIGGLALLVAGVLPVRISAGGAALVAAGLSLLFAPVREMARGWNKLQESLAGTERVLEFLESPLEPEDPPDSLRICGVRESIEFRAVGFAYDSTPVLHDISFDARPGEMIAIVGRTGAGKSTLMDLLMRFYDPTEGAILVDGVDLRRIDRRMWRRGIALVPQDPFLFHATLGENIRYGRPEATDEEVCEAARAARLHEFIESLPERYDTVVGERGVRLSGGERQRVAIARALLRRPRILILDEPTSSLDAKTEAEIYAALDDLMARDTQGRITFVIAHRLSTVRQADRIIVLEGGRLVESGRHEELISAGGWYRALFEIQSR
jgi:subfamily B ATP-binding cassette protein MsbA